MLLLTVYRCQVLSICGLLNARLVDWEGWEEMFGNDTMMVSFTYL